MKRTWKTRQITPLRNGKPTKTAKALKVWKIKVIALIIVSTYTALITIRAWDMAVGNQLEPLAEVAEAKTEPSMKEWVLEEVKNAGIDPYEAYMIINCESRWNDQAINGSHNNGGNGTDLGLWQINTKYQPQVSPKEALDYKLATKYAIEIYKARGNRSAWSCAKIVGL